MTSSGHGTRVGHHEKYESREFSKDPGRGSIIGRCPFFRCRAALRAGSASPLSISTEVFGPIPQSFVGGETANFDEGHGIGDDMVGGQRYRQNIFIALGCKCCAGSNSGDGIPPHRFKQVIRGMIVGANFVPTAD